MRRGRSGARLDQLFEVRAVVGKKVQSANIYYKILWEGYSDKDFTWEPISHLVNCVHLVAEYEERQKEYKPLEQSTSPESEEEVGNFSKGDQIDSILSARVRGEVVEFQVSWAARKEGHPPGQSTVTNEEMKAHQPMKLIEFYQKKIRWN